MSNRPTTHLSMSSSSEVDNSLESNMASGSHIGLNRVLKKINKNYPRIKFLIPELFSNRPIPHFSMLSGSQADDSLESNMAARCHIGFEKCKK